MQEGMDIDFPHGNFVHVLQFRPGKSVEVRFINSAAHLLIGSAKLTSDEQVLHCVGGFTEPFLQTNYG